MGQRSFGPCLPLWLLGTIYKLGGIGKWPRFSLFLYLTLGWLGIVTLWICREYISPKVLLLIVVGGLFYTIGTYFYARDFFKWYHTIWHLFVLLAGLAHFWAIWGDCSTGISWNSYAEAILQVSFVGRR